MKKEKIESIITQFTLTHTHIIAIRSASENGYQDIGKLLLADNRADPSADDNYGKIMTLIKQLILFDTLE